MIDVRPCPTGCGRTVAYQGRGPRRRCDDCRSAPYQPKAPPKTVVDVPAGCPLSTRELDLLKLLATGLTYGEIAPKFGVTTSTVRTHLHNIYGKLGVGNRAHAVLVASEEGWLEHNLTGHNVPHEVKLLRNVEHLLLGLIDAVERRRQRLHITRAQDQYLREFEGYLRAHTHGEIVQRRGRSIALLWRVLDEAGIERGHVGRGRRRAGPKVAA